MNTQLTASLHQPSDFHPPDPFAPNPRPAGRTSLLDRAAMRVGLWLVLWGSRHAAEDAALARHRRHAFRAHQRARHEAVQAHATRLFLHRG